MITQAQALDFTTIGWLLIAIFALFAGIAAYRMLK